MMTTQIEVIKRGQNVRMSTTRKTRRNAIRCGTRYHRGSRSSGHTCCRIHHFSLALRTDYCRSQNRRVRSPVSEVQPQSSLMRSSDDQQLEHRPHDILWMVYSGRHTDECRGSVEEKQIWLTLRVTNRDASLHIQIHVSVRIPRD